MTATLVRMGRQRKTEPSDPVRIPRSVVKRIRRIAAHLDMDPGDFIAEHFGKVLDKAESAMLADIAREKAGDDPPAKPRPA